MTAAINLVLGAVPGGAELLHCGYQVRRGAGRASGSIDCWLMPRHSLVTQSRASQTRVLRPRPRTLASARTVRLSETREQPAQTTLVSAQTTVPSYPFHSRASALSHANPSPEQPKPHPRIFPCIARTNPNPYYYPRPAPGEEAGGVC